MSEGQAGTFIVFFTCIYIFYIERNKADDDDDDDDSDSEGQAGIQDFLMP